MNKQIKVRLAAYDHDLKKSRVDLVEQAFIGDYFYLEDFLDNNKLIDKKYFYQRFEKNEEAFKALVEAELSEKIRANLFQEFKGSEEYQKLESMRTKLSMLEQAHETEINNIKLATEAKYVHEMNVLKNRLSKHEQDLALLQKDHLQQMKAYQAEAVQKAWAEIAPKVREEAKKELTAIFDEQREQWKTEKAQLELRIAQFERTQSNIKLMGQDLENHVGDRLHEFINFKHGYELIREHSLTDLQKIDYLLKIAEPDPNAPNEYYSEKIAIECKTQAKDLNGVSGKQKNETFYKKVVGYATKSGARWAVLVTELEPESQFTILKIPQDFDAKVDLYIVRPQFLVTLVQMIIHIFSVYVSYVSFINQQKSAKNDSEQYKAKFMDEFQAFKDYFNKYCEEYLEQQCGAITKEINKIEAACSNIKIANEKILGKKLTSLITKFETLTPKLDKKYQKFLNSLPPEQISTDEVNYPALDSEFTD